MTETVLLTGSSGSVGRMITPYLLAAGMRVRGFDLAAPPPPEPPLVELPLVEPVETPLEHPTHTTGSILDPAALDAALVGVDAVVHLAGIPTEAAWADLLSANIDGTQRVLEAARRNGVRRVILASSNHAVGFVPAEQSAIASDLPPQPDTFYGVSKAALEALGHYYHSKHGMDVVSIRIGTAEVTPPTRRSLRTWISPRDLGGLVVAGIRAQSPVDAVVWGISPNAGSPFRLDAGIALGWQPQDDATRVVAERDLELAPESDADRRYVGGDFTALEQPGS
jgi:uronate dehydrogenase